MHMKVFKLNIFALIVVYLLLVMIKSFEGA